MGSKKFIQLFDLLLPLTNNANCKIRSKYLKTEVDLPSRGRINMQKRTKIRDEIYFGTQMRICGSILEGKVKKTKGPQQSM